MENPLRDQRVFVLFTVVELMNTIKEPIQGIKYVRRGMAVYLHPIRFVMSG